MASRMSKKTRLNKTRLIIIVALVVAVGAIVGITVNRSSGSPSSTALNISTWDETSLSTLEGTPLVLNFWSISCPWCKKQLPYLENAAQQSEGEIKVVAINVGESASRRHRIGIEKLSWIIVGLTTTQKAISHSHYSLIARV